MGDFSMNGRQAGVLALAAFGALCAGSARADVGVVGTAVHARGGQAHSPDAWTVNAARGDKTLLLGRVQYDPDTCLAVDEGAWTVDEAPKYGDISFAPVTTTLAGGPPCGGTVMEFAGLYYTWTDKKDFGKTDQLTATWKSAQLTVDDSFTVNLVRAQPINWAQVGAGTDTGKGVLHFDYNWQSNTGDLADLSQCEVGEIVNYPGDSDPFKWPHPPYHGATDNPTVIWLAATAGVAQDNHSPVRFQEPYKVVRFKAKQAYRYRCTGVPITNFAGFDSILISRTVSDSTGRGCFNYEVDKSGSSATERLPHVTDHDCAAKAPSAVQASANSAADLELALAGPPRAAVLGAPMFVDLDIRNRQAEPVDIDLGLNRTANFVIAIEGPDGEHAIGRLAGAGFGASGRMSLTGHGQTRQRLLLNQWRVFRRPGTYQVTVALEGAAAEGPAVRFQVQILPRDAAELTRLSEAWAKAALQGPTAAARIEAARTLSYIAVPEAVGALKQVLDHGPTLEGYAIQGLQRIGTPEAISALMAAAHSHRDPEVRNQARAMLRLMDGSSPTAQVRD